MFLQHIIEPIIVMGAFLAIAGIAAVIIARFANKFNTDEQNQGLLESIEDVYHKGFHIVNKTGDTLEKIEEKREEKKEEKRRRKQCRISRLVARLSRQEE